MQRQGLYDPRHEHDACGVGFVVNINGTQSHDIIEKGIEVLQNLEHRGAVGGDATTGDGAGILFQIPDAFFRKTCSTIGIELPPAGGYGIGMLFLPPDSGEQILCREIVEETVSSTGLHLLGWRDVPVDPQAPGELARKSQPSIAQCFIDGKHLRGGALERKLYVLRRRIENKVIHTVKAEDRFYIPSLSCFTIVYKGMLLATQLNSFYGDLTDPDLVSAIAVIHQRYSTNTFPSWKLAQPFHRLAHNGEINTLRGNKNHMAGREKRCTTELFKDDLKHLLPVIDETGSDSACLDNALEFLNLGGRDIAHAMMMLIPQAWGKKYPIGPDLRGFFEYHAGMMEPWDGPAAVAFTDGTIAGALLDRNGLRPCRYTITEKGLLVLSSETGVLPIPAGEIKETGALRPGEILLVDTEKKRVLKDKEVKMTYSRRQPYRRWVEENKIVLRGLFGEVAPVKMDTNQLFFRQNMFGYTREDINLILTPMATTGAEPKGSMGVDIPLAVLSEKPQLLYNYFKQMFAQITNPAIDPIREELVMSLMTFIGNPADILSEVPANARLLKFSHPVLTNGYMSLLKKVREKGFGSRTLTMEFNPTLGEDGLKQSLEDLCAQAEKTVNEGKSIIILSDRGLADNRAPIPALLALSAVNRRLVQKSLRTFSSILVETGEAREVHHLAMLLGYGASAVNPYLAFETLMDVSMRNGLGEITLTRAMENYINALCKGLLKIMSKMGISTLRSYRGAQIFQAVGLNSDFVNTYFPDTISPIEGIGLTEIAEEVRVRYLAAIDSAPDRPKILPGGGSYRFRHDGERHHWSPEAITKIQQATRRNDTALYREFTKLINNQSRKLNTIRGMFTFKKTKPVPIEDVERAESIMKRFVTAAMSFGSISQEVHETLAIAMNRIGARSNSGEGGEDPERYKPMENGDSRMSAIKQVASGRFGVTIDYLSNAREIQIKIAQGAKPGEGGHLPGHKVNPVIAKVRNSTPGVTLISPPPHHDIYSIEDIKQLIFDLKNANPEADVSVKLVSEMGVGTIATGVSKGYADMVLISGYDGGTGASPLSSIKHAGIPWELGLAETQQTLVLNDLRTRIRVQTDGGLKTGRDVVIAAMLGAEEFGFGTMSLVVCGCVMMRKCNENICPVGIATQNPELRKRFKGKPEYVVNFFRMLAEDVREHLAMLGFKKLDDLIGRTDLLDTNRAIDFWKARNLDFSKLFYKPDGVPQEKLRRTEKQDHKLERVLDRTLISLAEPALDRRERVEIDLPIRNINLTTGTMLSGVIARKYGGTGLPDDTITCRFTGSAGQSFATFGARGVTFRLEGDANDYLGKGLSGAKIIVVPPKDARFDPSQNIICGNVLLYGATSGEVYIRGRAGERFAIRNSGACAVVEGVGDHGCEYMTGGRVVVLGETGVNFAAGMSGGLAYIYDPHNMFDGRCNLDMVDLDLLSHESDRNEVRSMLENHFKYTGSTKAAFILENWETCAPLFVKVFPMEYRRALGQMSKEDEATERDLGVSA